MHMVDPTVGRHVQLFTCQIIYIFDPFGLNLFVCLAGGAVHLFDFFVLYGVRVHIAVSVVFDQQDGSRMFFPELLDGGDSQSCNFLLLLIG